MRPFSQILFATSLACLCALPGCECTIPGTRVYGFTQQLEIDILRDAGVPEAVVLHGDACLPLCYPNPPAISCFYGRRECIDDLQGSDASLPRECLPLPANSHYSLYFSRCTPQSCGPSGRRMYETATASHALASPLSTLARLEHESITAFTEMASFLALHDAPASLLSRLTIAAEDESRHTAAMLRLAEHLEKSSPTLPTATPTHPASLLDFALHNAREGCVRETYGAALAYYQSTHATDALVRETFATIAIEESQHAQLSWDVAAWVDSLLTDAERALVTDAIAESSAELAHSLAAPPPGDWRDVLGLPSADIALSIYQQLRRGLWKHPATA